MTEQPMMMVHPHCPKCGLMCMWLRRRQFVADVVPVRCDCGWEGAARQLLPMPVQLEPVSP